MPRIKGLVLSGTSQIGADGDTSWVQDVRLVDSSGNSTASLPAGTDRSGTAGTSSTTLAAANTARRGLNIQNISANNLGINEFGGTAAIGSPGTYTIAAGAAVNVRTSNAITVIASAAGSAYTATEF